MVEVNICGRWPLLMPAFRAARPHWPWWEWPRLESMRRNLYPGDVLFDVGAELGDQSALYAWWVEGEVDGEHGGVVLVEPNPKCWPSIRAVWEANGVYPALGWFQGFAADRSRFDDELGITGWPACAEGEITDAHGLTELHDRRDIARITVDALAELLRPPDAVTIDVEGAELLVLRGAAKTLVDHRPLVWVSIHVDFMRDLYGHERADLIEFMADLGYRHEHLADEHEQHALFWHPEGREPILPYSWTNGHGLVSS